jgi:hypothetical protein
MVYETCRDHPAGGQEIFTTFGQLAGERGEGG